MNRRFYPGGSRDQQVQLYSERRAEREFQDRPLPHADLVKIQQLACRGRTVDQIVAEVQIAREDVMKALEPSENAVARKPHRQARAGVGFHKIKRGWPGYGRR
jgi:hypothetical protein